jgi:GntR family transcriptional regulator / MocR family aminotransferase
VKAGTAPTSLVSAPDRSSPVPLHRQLYEGIRGDILAGRLAAGTRLPATRALAVELGVSRNTVMGAYLQLLSEGYARGRVGAGTYVAAELPDDLLSAGSGSGRRLGETDMRRGLSKRGEVLAATPATTARDLGAPRAFRSGVPGGFPSRAWARISGKIWRRPPRGLLGYGDPSGYGPLRGEISA